MATYSKITHKHIRTFVIFIFSLIFRLFSVSGTILWAFLPHWIIWTRKWKLLGQEVEKKTFSYFKFIHMKLSLTNSINSEYISPVMPVETPWDFAARTSQTMMATSRIAPYTIVRPLDWDIWLRTFFFRSGCFSSWWKNLSSSATSGVVVADDWYHCPLVAKVVTTWKQMSDCQALLLTCLQFYTTTKLKILLFRWHHDQIQHSDGPKIS